MDSIQARLASTGKKAARNGQAQARDGNNIVTKALAQLADFDRRIQLQRALQAGRVILLSRRK